MNELNMDSQGSPIVNLNDKNKDYRVISFYNNNFSAVPTLYLESQKFGGVELGRE